MDFRTIKEMLAERLGRPDMLAGPDRMNAGYYINAGVRILDLKVNFYNRPQQALSMLRPGENSATFSTLKRVDAVFWILNSVDYARHFTHRPAQTILVPHTPWQVRHYKDKGFFQYSASQILDYNEYNGMVVPNNLKSLEAMKHSPFVHEGRVELKQISQAYAYKMFPKRSNNHLRGKPQYYTLTSPKDAVERDEFFVPMRMLDLDLTATAKTRIHIYPETNALGFICVLGAFFSRPLCKDHDTNMWLNSNPKLVLDAASYVYETGMRNTQGAADILASMNYEIDLMNANDIEQELASPMSMRG